MLKDDSIQQVQSISSHHLLKGTIFEVKILANKEIQR